MSLIKEAFWYRKKVLNSTYILELLGEYLEMTNASTKMFPVILPSSLGWTDTEGFPDEVGLF